MSRLFMSCSLLLAATLMVLGCSGATPTPYNENAPQTTIDPPIEPVVEGERPEEETETGTPKAKEGAGPTDPESSADPETAEPETDPDSKADADPESAAPESSDPASKVKTDPNGESTEVKQASEADPEKTQQSAAPQSAFKTERVALFTIQGPLLIDIELSIDNAPHEEALQKLVEYVLKQADTNEDGRPTWEELTNSPKFAYGQLGNVELTTAEMKRNAINLYDVVKNGRVDASEVPRFLTRNAGGSRSFDFRSANYYRDINRGDSPLLKMLDANEDGRIDYEEAERAEVKLLSRDADSDGVLFLDEVASANDDRPGPLTQRRVSAPSSSSWLGGRPKWTNVLYAMEEQYMLGGHLEKSAFALSPDLFDRLNTNGDERIDAKEVEAMATVEPHIRIEAHFGELEKSDSPRLKLSFLHDKMKDLITYQVGLNRITLNLPQDRLLIFLKDNARVQQVEQRATALLNQYDADNNKYLDEDEFPDAAPGLMGGLEAYDTDGDEKVYKKEIVEYLANAGVAQKSQIRSRAGDQTDALFDALDANRDGRLDGREISGIPAKLKSLDQDNDGEIIVDEIPGSMALAVVRGDPQQADALFAIPVARPTPLENAPRWFTSMDRNQDGAVALGEFLGDRKQFDKLDRNADGFVGSDEIEIPKKPAEQTDEASEVTPDAAPEESPTDSKDAGEEALSGDEAAEKTTADDEASGESKPAAAKDASKAQNNDGKTAADESEALSVDDK